MQIPIRFQRIPELSDTSKDCRLLLLQDKKIWVKHGSCTLWYEKAFLTLVSSTGYTLKMQKPKLL